MEALKNISSNGMGGTRPVTTINPQSYEDKIAAGIKVSPAEKKAYEQWKAAKEAKRSMGK